ncbi:MAG: hypothetical protein WEC75_13480 [Dehalococcoidia bacterium]
MKLIAVATLAASLALTALATPSPRERAASATEPPTTVGIWYSTWWSNNGRYIWARGHGAFSHTQLLADVDGDVSATADAVSVDAVNGDWYVTTSNGSSFGSESPWLLGFRPNSTKQFLADVNGDSKADAIAFEAAQGAWWVALSTGTSFAPTPMPWLQGFGVGTSQQFVADVGVNGGPPSKAKADAVTFDVTTGDWWVAVSDGTRFSDVPSRWVSEHGPSSSFQFMADADGDGNADAVSVDTINPNGDWWVSLSNGVNSFGQERQWLDGFGIGSWVLMGDVTGDGKSDAITYVESSSYAGGGAAWYRAAATTTGTCEGGLPAPCFSTLESDAMPWKRLLGHSPFHFHSSTPHTPATWLGVADVRGVGTADPVAFHRDTGVWKTLPSDCPVEQPGGIEPCDSPNTFNRWEAFDVPYLPITHGEPAIYDSADPPVIAEHLEQISDAGIDYLLFDLTNGFGTDGIFGKALEVCQQIDVFDDAGHDLRFAIAIGNHQSDPGQVEVEAGYVRQMFVDDPVCGNRYQHWDDEPLLVLFDSWDTRQAWESPSTPKTNTPEFTILWASGLLPECASGDCDDATYSSRDQGGCPDDPPINNFPPPANYGEYVGWGTPWGSVGAGPVMTVMPGWHTTTFDPIGSGTNFVSRTQYGVPDGFYSQCGWIRVLGATPRPRMVVIASYNEYIEETAVQPADTSAVVPCQYCSESWPDEYYYWNLTKAFVLEYHGLRSVGGRAEQPQIVRRDTDSRGTAYWIVAAALAVGVAVACAAMVTTHRRRQ